MIYCTQSNNRVKSKVVEGVDSANNYLAEILGGIMTQLVLQTASSPFAPNSEQKVVDYDNTGVVLHGNSSWQCIKEKQAQADVLYVFRQLVSRKSFQLLMK